MVLKFLVVKYLLRHKNKWNHHFITLLWLPMLSLPPSALPTFRDLHLLACRLLHLLCLVRGDSRSSPPPAAACRAAAASASRRQLRRLSIGGGGARGLPRLPGPHDSHGVGRMGWRRWPGLALRAAGRTGVNIWKEAVGLPAREEERIGVRSMCMLP